MNLNLPKISIVTPSFNQGRFLRAALRSVLDQDYPAIESIVMDGGSTDESPEVIREFESRLHFSRSGPDGGQYAAINTGFLHSSGEVMGWLNSDDMLTPWSLSIVGEIFATFPQVEWLTTLYPLRWDERGRAVRCSRRHGYSRAGFMAGENMPTGPWFYESWIQQEATFWRRSLWQRAGGSLDTRWKVAADFELWARFFQHAELYAVDTPLGGFRFHGDQKTTHQQADYMREAREIFRAAGGETAGRWRSLVRSNATRCLPDGLRRWGHRCGLLHASRQCLRQRGNHGWKLVSALH